MANTKTTTRTQVTVIYEKIASEDYYTCYIEQASRMKAKGKTEEEAFLNLAILWNDYRKFEENQERSSLMFVNP